MVGHLPLATCNVQFTTCVQRPMFAAMSNGIGSMHGRHECARRQHDARPAGTAPWVATCQTEWVAPVPFLQQTDCQSCSAV